MACLTFRRGLIGVSPSDRRFCKLDNLQRTDVRQSKPPLASPQMSFGVRLSRIHFSPTDKRNECVTNEPQRTSAGRLNPHVACVAGLKRGGGGGREKGKIPLPFFPSSLSRTPYPFRRLLRRLTPARSLLPVIKRSFRSFWEGETPCGWMLLSISAVGRQIFGQRPTRTVKT